MLRLGEHDHSPVHSAVPDHAWDSTNPAATLQNRDLVTLDDPLHGSLGLCKVSERTDNQSIMASNPRLIVQTLCRNSFQQITHTHGNYGFRSRQGSRQVAKGIKRFQPILTTAKSRDDGEADTVMIITDMLAEIFGYVGGCGKTGEKRRFEIPLGERVFERRSPISVASWVKSRVCEHGSQVLLRECCVRLSKLVG